jgi:glycosyltransferase involved in cell wall biosynthesis
MNVSILINNYNYASFLDECLTSTMNQTKQPLEVILYDDGSNDDSIEIAKKYDFVKILSNPNFGKRPAFNQGNAIYQAFLESKGDIICLLDSDDFFAPEKLESIIDEFTKDQEVVLVQNAFYEFKGGAITRVCNFGYSNEDYRRLYYQKRWSGFYNPTSCLSFRRSYLSKVLPIEMDENWKVWPDVRISRIAPFYGRVQTLNIPLTYYRKHGNSDSDFMNSRPTKTLKNQLAHHEYLNQKIKELGFAPLKFQFSWNYFKYRVKSWLGAFFFLINYKKDG